MFETQKQILSIFPLSVQEIERHELGRLDLIRLLDVGICKGHWENTST